VPLPPHLEAVQAEYAAALRQAPVDDDTRRAYGSRVRQYLAWLEAAAVDRDPLADSAGRDWAVRDYRAHLQTVAKRKPSTINTTLAAIADFYTRRGLGPPDVRRLELPQSAPRALAPREATRWLRVVLGCIRPRDRLLGLIPFYAGLRIGEVVALDVDDVRLSARKGVLIVRSGKRDHYRELPVHPELRANLAIWLEERPDWPGATVNPALLLNHRGGRLTTRGARDVLVALAVEARLEEEFTSHVLRHTFGTTLIRSGHDLVLVAELMGHQRLETTRGYTRPSRGRSGAGHRQPADRSLISVYGGFRAYSGRTPSGVHSRRIRSPLNERRGRRGRNPHPRDGPGGYPTLAGRDPAGVAVYLALPDAIGSPGPVRACLIRRARTDRCRVSAAWRSRCRSSTT
jgi:site-specific recombinase XerD